MNEAWIAFLAAQGGHLADGAVSDFGAPEAELAAAAAGSVIAPLESFALLEIAGSDATEFLQGQLSCDVKGLAADAATLGSYNTPKGRMLASFVLWHDAGGYQMMLSRSIAAAIAKRLRMFVLRSKVTIADRTGERVLLGAAGPAAGGALQAVFGAVPGAPYSLATHAGTALVRIGADRYVAAVPSADAQHVWAALCGPLRPVGGRAWDWIEVTSGLPFITASTQDQLVPQMANLELIGGVSFSKGCYPGQEIVARTQYLGKVKRRMYLARVATDALPRPGDALYSEDVGDQSNGLVLNAAPAPDGGYDLLAVVQSASMEASRVHLGAPDGPVLHFRPLPYAVQ